MKFNDYADGSKFILQTDLYTMDHHSYDDQYNILTHEEVMSKIHMYAKKDSVWTYNKPEQTMTGDDGNGSINVHMDADVDEKMWMFWDHNYQSGIESVTITYCTRYNGCRFKVKDDESVDEAILEKLEETCEEICDFLVNECNEDGDYYGSEGDAEEYIVNLIQRTVGSNTQVKVKFDHYSS